MPMVHGGESAMSVGRPNGPVQPSPMPGKSQVEPSPQPGRPRIDPKYIEAYNFWIVVQGDPKEFCEDQGLDFNEFAKVPEVAEYLKNQGQPQPPPSNNDDSAYIKWLDEGKPDPEEFCKN
jgi:hypothetical protein